MGSEHFTVAVILYRDIAVQIVGIAVRPEFKFNCEINLSSISGSVIKIVYTKYAISGALENVANF